MCPCCGIIMSNSVVDIMQSSSSVDHELQCINTGYLETAFSTVVAS